VHLKITKDFSLFFLLSSNLILAVILFVLGACKTIDSKTKKDLSPYINKPLAFFTAIPPSNLKKVWPKIIKNTESSLREIEYLGRLIGLDEQKKIFRKNSKLRSELNTYLNTLKLTEISEKETAWKLGNKLGCQYFLFLDLTSFSCTEGCSSNHQWIIRLKLLDVKSGETIIWVRRRYELSEHEINTQSYYELAEKLTSEVVNEFGSGFIIPWHQWRFVHLNPSSI